jgi:hypothetical protein
MPPIPRTPPSEALLTIEPPPAVLAIAGIWNLRL